MLAEQVEATGMRTNGRVRTVGALVLAVLIVSFLGLVPVRAAAAQAGQTLDLRVLVLSGDASTDPGLVLIEEVLVESRVPYTVLDSNAQDLTADMLFDGSHGFFNGVILTDAELFVPPDTSGFSVPEWELLHEYERVFGVRESVMSGSPTDVSSALDYGLTEVFADSGIVGQWVGPAGSTVFEYVNVDNTFFLSDYAVTSVRTGSGPEVTPVLVDSSAPDNLLISILDYDDGRQVLFSSIAQASFLVHARVMAYEFVRFATSGVHLGAHRNYLSVHVDDLFLGSAVWNGTESFSDSAQPYRNDVDDIAAVVDSQNAINERFSPLLDDLRWELAFNGLGSPLVNIGDLAIEADTVVSEALPRRQYGRSGDLRFGRTARGMRVALYRFEATPPESDVGTVLRITRRDDGPVRGTVCALTQPWEESEASWMDASTGVVWEGELGPAYDDGSCVRFDLERSSDPIEIRSLIDHWRDNDHHGVAVTVEGRSLNAPSREAGSGAVLHYGTAPTLPDPLTEMLQANSQSLAFLNHTFSHRDLDASNATGRDEAFFELSRNIQAWGQLGFPGLDENRQTVVTGQHSGLSEDQGTFFDQSDDIFYPEGANPGLLDSMEDLEIRYVAGDSSRPNQMVEQFVPDRDIVLLPRYPANVFFDVRTPAEMTSEYNFLFHQTYLDRGLDPCVEPGARCEPVDYERIVVDEARLALLRLLSGKRWPHYFHINNIVDYDGQGSTLIGDWLTGLLSSYEELVILPIDSPRFSAVGAMSEAAILAERATMSAVLDRGNGTVTIESDTALSLEATGLAGGVEHGGMPVQSISLVVGSPITFDVAVEGSLTNAGGVGAGTLSALTPDMVSPSARLAVTGGVAPREALIVFETPVAASVLVASLSLRDVRVGGVEALEAEICAVAQQNDPNLATWTESGVDTWEGAAGATVDDSTCLTTELRHGEDATLDVTAIAAAWSAGTPNYGVVVRTASGGASFGSFDSADPPTLVITSEQ
jgi:hypothetical protein